MENARVTNAFVNVGHAIDHMAMLIFPTVALAMTAEFGLSYGDKLWLTLGGFIAFGAGSLPAGWLGDRWGRRPMMIAFFLGIGAATILTGLARQPWQVALCLTLVGLFAAIYHPVGLAMLVRDETRLGRALGWNGLCGNLGVAFAALAAGGLADTLGWRAAFIVPGIVAILVGLAFAAAVPAAPAPARGAPAGAARPARDRVVRRVFALLTVTTVCGGLIFNATTFAMPKLFDERLRALVDTTFGVGALVCFVYVIAALAQLLVGRLIDGRPLRAVFLPLALLQVPLLLLAGALQDWAMLLVAVAMMFIVFGLIPINDAMVARYAHDAWRSRVYAVRYVVSFTASSLAVPLVAWLQPAAGGYQSLFAVLTALGVGTLAAALFFPASEAVGVRQPGAAAKPPNSHSSSAANAIGVRSSR